MKLFTEIRLRSPVLLCEKRSSVKPRVSPGGLRMPHLAPKEPPLPPPQPSQKDCSQYRLLVPVPSNGDLQKQWGPPAAWSLWVVRDTNEMTHPSGRTALSSQGRWVGVISSSGLAGLALLGARHQGSLQAPIGG